MKKLGVKLETNVIIGKSVTIDEPMEEEAFRPCSSVRAGLPKFAGTGGECERSVPLSYNEYLIRSNLD